MRAEPHTVTMNVSLPVPLKAYVDGKVTTGIYGSASEFVREAIREKLQRDQERAEAKKSLTAKLLEGLDSGEPIRLKPGHFARKKRTLAKRLSKSKKS